MNLVLELVAGPPEAHPQGVTALDHERRNDPVENDPVVERCRHRIPRLGVCPQLRAIGKTDEVCDGLRSMVTKKVNSNIPVICLDGCGLCVN